MNIDLTTAVPDPATRAALAAELARLRAEVALYRDRYARAFDRAGRAIRLAIGLELERDAARRVALGLAERVAAQSELLSRKAERA